MNSPARPLIEKPHRPLEPPDGTLEASRDELRGLDSRQEYICGHIFTVSATMVGVCLTVIGVLRAVSRLGLVNTIADELLSINAGGFLLACVVAYAALRTRDRSGRRRLERYADAAFLSSLGLMTVTCAVIAWELI